MKNVVIHGNSLAAFEAAQAIRSQAADWPINIILPDEEYPFDSLLLGEFLSKKLSAEKILAAPKADYSKNNITVATKKIQRVNFNKKRLTNEEKEVIPFDIFILTAGSWALPAEIKGLDKEGVYSTQSLAQFRLALKQLPLVETVFIQGDDLASLRLVGSLADSQKEIIWVTSRENMGADFLSPESSAMLTDFLKEQGVRCIPQDSLVEMLGDETLKAVRLKNGKVIASQMAFVSPVRTDLKLFKETGLELGEETPASIRVETNFPEVFALGVVRGSTELLASGYDSYRQLIKQEAENIAARLFNNPMKDSSFVPQSRLRIAERYFTLLDRTLSVEGGDLFLTSGESVENTQTL